MFGLEGRVAVVTGAGRGNGAAIATGLAGAGAVLALSDIDVAAVRAQADVLSRTGATAFATELDVIRREACQAFADEVRRRLGPCAVLVNNAGIIRRTLVDEAGEAFEADWDATFRVNLDGAMHMVRAFLPQLVETRGTIVNIASIMSLSAGPGLAAYAASKGALAQFTKALAHDLAPHGVRVNAIMPGVIDTPMTEQTRANPDAIGRFMTHTPMRRTGRPDELAGPVVFLASQAASYVTGALLPVDGGYLAS